MYVPGLGFAYSMALMGTVAHARYADPILTLRKAAYMPFGIDTLSPVDEKRLITAWTYRRGVKRGDVRDIVARCSLRIARSEIDDRFIRLVFLFNDGSRMSIDRDGNGYFDGCTFHLLASDLSWIESILPIDLRDPRDQTR